MTHVQFLAALDWTGGPPANRRMPPGIIVRDKTGATFLVGDVNQVGGVCDCCSGCDARDVVAWAWLPGWPLDEVGVAHQEGEVTA